MSATVIDFFAVLKHSLRKLPRAPLTRTARAIGEIDELARFRPATLAEAEDALERLHDAEDALADRIRDENAAGRAVLTCIDYLGRAENVRRVLQARARELRPLAEVIKFPVPRRRTRRGAAR